MRKLISFLICSFSLLITSCLTTPGLEEPVITECVIDFPNSHCGNVLVPTEELLGYIAVSPEDRAKIANHHDALHTKLNQCK